MIDNSRVENLRRRVQQDPSSIAFAQLAEEYRRAGMFQEAVEACRSGLTVHPGYVSARVTLGRALIGLHQYEPAQQELEQVLRTAPENLAAIRGLADALNRLGLVQEAVVQYRAALTLARHDPDLEQTIADLERQLESTTVAVPVSLASVDRPASLDETAEASIAIAAVEPAADEGRVRALATLAALEQLLTGVHAARAQRCA
jgi:tetratricopeptide (TPR) repeat protein